MNKLAYGIQEAKALLSIGRSSIYELIGAGQLDARKIGGRTVITAASINALLRDAPQARVGRV